MAPIDKPRWHGYRNGHGKNSATSQEAIKTWEKQGMDCVLESLRDWAPVLPKGTYLGLLSSRDGIKCGWV